MGFRFRRSVRLFPGVRLNFSLSGVSVSAGVPGAMINIGPRGSRLTMGLPGTGISYVHNLSSPRPTKRLPSPVEVYLGPPATPEPMHPTSEPQPEPLVGEIKSAEVASLTSPDLEGLKKLINDAVHQKALLQGDLTEAVADRRRAWRKLRRREQWPLRLLMKSSIPAARISFEEAEEEALKVAAAIIATEIKVEIDLDDQTWSAWAEVRKAFDRLSQTAKFWDVTSSVHVDRYRTRSAAHQTITRTPVGLRTVFDGIVATPGGGHRFENANGGDLDIFPGFMLIRDKASSDYALIDFRDLAVETYGCRFIENETVPPDAEVVGHAWHKSNKDGSPDRRFAQNFQIPIALYGEIRFKTRNGVEEAYNASHCGSALAFGHAISSFQDALRRQVKSSKPAVGPAAAGEGPQKDPSALLPALPKVLGAYEVIAIPALLAGLIAYGPASNLVRPKPASVPMAVISPVPAVTVANAERPSTSSTPVSARSQAAPNQPAAAPLPTPVSTSAPAAAAPTVVEKMVVKQNANVRANPDRAAASLRVVPIGTTVSVFEKRGSWIRIGDTAAWGWTHTSLLQP
ncbi:hypothetical protein B6S44_21600 [Bosea sp. Tri-44]|uniref:DUF4236 domain-containing protein n=1 Tax=Bosea sp. Tri-44 TaxID=1972137 RepID=UPI00100E4FD4|nr:DUF4236 domain-containing protein [Bosea sp. Tri-44]RXT51202.1 hypothetical protein B6S44_21600 [Bosea sp. Tri-44]